MLRKHTATICLLTLAFMAGMAARSPDAIAAKSADRVYELRTYTAAEGKLPLLLARFGGGEIDLFHKHGMTSVGYWVPDDAELAGHTLVYMLAHESREAAAASWAAFRDDPDWQKMSETSQVDGRFLVSGGVRSMFLNPTDFSPAK